MFLESRFLPSSELLSSSPQNSHPKEKIGKDLDFPPYIFQAAGFSPTPVSSLPGPSGLNLQLQKKRQRS